MPGAGWRSFENGAAPRLWTSCTRHPAPSTLYPAFDIVTVPDFRPAPRAAFEARTLFLLASWRERAGEARGRCPLHLACIGEPPRSVVAWAERAGARVSVHAPLELGSSRSANKLRGFGVPTEMGRRLLVDTDVLFLGDPLRALHGLPPDHLAAAPATVPRVPPELWGEIYGTFGMSVPGERMRSVSGALGFPPEAQGYPPDPMPPYFNSGVLLVPDACPLRPRWEEHLARLPARFADRAAGWPEPARRAVLQSDQAALATALASLGAEGWARSPLPDAAHARRVHFRGGALRVGDVAILHAIGLFKGLPEATPDAVEDALETWLARWQAAIREGLPGRRWRAWRECRRAAGLVNGLWRRHVQPALRRA